jgi:hypothetical protein
MKTAFIVFIFSAICLGQTSFKEFSENYVDTSHKVTVAALKSMVFEQVPIGMTPNQVVEKYGKCSYINAKKTKKGYKITLMTYQKVEVDTLPLKKGLIYRKRNYSNATLLFVNDTCKNTRSTIF